MSVHDVGVRLVTRGRARVSLLALAAATIAVFACASPAEPPGGPIDVAPPRLVATTPDSGGVRVKLSDVDFQFDEVLAEQPRGAQTLAGIVLISPTDGDPVVEWKRSRITVHPKHGWRANTAYVITLMAGVTDLRGNVRDSSTTIVFSTGDSIPTTRMTGAVFDWSRGAAAPRAYVDARPAADTMLSFATESDSTGRFSLPYLPRGEYIVRAIIDANRNRALDPREQWQSARVTLRDSAAVDLYTFTRDSFPRVRSVVVTDSLTLHLTFDKPIKPDSGYVPTIEARTADSTALAIRRVIPWSVYTAERDERARITRDSAAAADTSTARRAARERVRLDSIERAVAIADSIARDPKRRLPPLVSARPALVTELAVTLAAPLVVGTRYFVTAHAAGLVAGERRSETPFTRPKPAEAPPAAKPPVKSDTLTTPAARHPRIR